MELLLGILRYTGLVFAGNFVPCSPCLGLNVFFLVASFRLQSTHQRPEIFKDSMAMLGVRLSDKHGAYKGGAKYLGFSQVVHA